MYAKQNKTGLKKNNKSVKHLCCKPMESGRSQTWHHSLHRLQADCRGWNKSTAHWVYHHHCSRYYVTIKVTYVWMLQQHQTNGLNLSHCWIINRS